MAYLKNYEKIEAIKSLFPNLSPIRKRGHLKCPDCDESMRPYQCKNVVVDKCESCHEIWFDHKEFGVFKRSLDSADLSRIKEIFVPPKEDLILISSCPRCNVALDEVIYSYNSKVRIKKCAKCRGLWLPIHDSLNLIELAKISQEISSDVKLVNREFQKYRNENEKMEELKQMGGFLNRRPTLTRFFFLRYFAFFVILLSYYRFMMKIQEVFFLLLQ